MFSPKPVTLSTDRVELQPLSLSHLTEFHQAANFDHQWTWVRPNPCTTIEQTQQWIEQALQGAEQGTEVPFVIIDKASNKLIGSTRYLSIARNDRGIEIGHTWLNHQFHRSYVNSSAKFLLLRHAFETLGAIRVEIKTHEKNERSRIAISRLGAKLDGVLRQNRILPDGSIRNTALYSIIDSEWPQVKDFLSQAIDWHIAHATA